jgi:hypothetical protein
VPDSVKLIDRLAVKSLVKEPETVDENVSDLDDDMVSDSVISNVRETVDVSE